MPSSQRRRGDSDVALLKSTNAFGELLKNVSVFPSPGPLKIHSQRSGDSLLGLSCQFDEVDENQSIANSIATAGTIGRNQHHSVVQGKTSTNLVRTLKIDFRTNHIDGVEVVQK